MNEQRAASGTGWSRSLLLLALAAVVLLGQVGMAAAAQPIVHAIFFYSTTCPHCEKLIREFLPPLGDQYGRKLQVLMVEVSGSSGRALYQAAIRSFKIPYERWGVPTVVIGDAVLVGEDEIPAQFPGLIQTYLAKGGCPGRNWRGCRKWWPACRPGRRKRRLPSA